MQVKIKRLEGSASFPMRATAGAACFDLFAVDDGKPHTSDPDAIVYSTGIAVEVPEGHVMLVFSRSGHGFRDGMRLSNCVGVIDPDYRGEIKVSLRRDGNSVTRPVHGDRIAQALVLPLPSFEFVEVDELSSTERGEAGFGSTGN